MSYLNIHSISSVKYAAVDASGVFPTTFTDVIYGVKDGTGTLTLPARDETDVFIEESPFAFATIRGNFAGAMLTLELIGATMESLAALSGWTHAAADATNPEKLTIAASDPQVFWAIEITGKNDEDKDMVVTFAKTSTNVGVDGSIGKADLTGVTFTSKVLQPVDASGVAVDAVVQIELGTKTA